MLYQTASGKKYQLYLTQKQFWKIWVAGDEEPGAEDMVSDSFTYLWQVLNSAESPFPKLYTDK